MRLGRPRFLAPHPPAAPAGFPVPTRTPPPARPTRRGSCKVEGLVGSTDPDATLCGVGRAVCGSGSQRAGRQMRTCAQQSHWITSLCRHCFASRRIFPAAQIPVSQGLRRARGFPIVGARAQQAPARFLPSEHCACPQVSGAGADSGHCREIISHLSCFLSLLKPFKS